MRQQIDLKNLSDKLPPLIARAQVEKLLGGIISSKTLANLDSEGKGPKRIRIGRKVVYQTVDLLEWLGDRSIILN